jgi:hypothetical protein
MSEQSKQLLSSIERVRVQSERMMAKLALKRSAVAWSTESQQEAIAIRYGDPATHAVVCSVSSIANLLIHVVRGGTSSDTNE